MEGVKPRKGLKKGPNRARRDDGTKARLSTSSGWSEPALMLLALGMARCGGSEPTAPAPPPFQPEAIEVALGTSGETLTLITTQPSGYTLNGEAFAPGTETESTAEGNGSTYTLTLGGSAWDAVYKAPAPMSLALGTTGGMISIQRLEDGSYQANGSSLENGRVTAGKGTPPASGIAGADSSSGGWHRATAMVGRYSQCAGCHRIKGGHLVGMGFSGTSGDC